MDNDQEFYRSLLSVGDSIILLEPSRMENVYFRHVYQILQINPTIEFDKYLGSRLEIVYDARKHEYYFDTPTYRERMKLYDQCYESKEMTIEEYWIHRRKN